APVAFLRDQVAGRDDRVAPVVEVDLVAHRLRLRLAESRHPEGLVADPEDADGDVALLHLGPGRATLVEARADDLALLADDHPVAERLLAGELVSNDGLHHLARILLRRGGRAAA